MQKKYVVKNFVSQEYYCGSILGWINGKGMSELFDSIEDADNFIERENGMFQIEVVYCI